MKKFLIKVVKTIVVLAVIVLTVLATLGYADKKHQEDIKLSNQLHGEELIAYQEKQSKLIDELKNSVVNDIRYQEVKEEVKDGDLFYVNDPRQSHYGKCQRISGKRSVDCDSWGVMQFKIKTVQYYSTKLRSEDLSEVEALILAVDENRAKDLAKEIIFNEVGGVWNWSTTHDERSYFNKQINAIRDLEKEIGLDTNY